MASKVASCGLPPASHAQIKKAIESASSNQPHGVFIDKLSMTFDIPNEGHASWINQQFMDMPKETDSGWVPGHRGAYKYGVRVHAPSDVSDGVQGPWSKDYVLLQADPKNGQGGYVRAEFNPARFDACQTAYIFSSLDNNLDLPPPQVGKAKVTRADLTVDLPGVKIGDYVFERTNSPIRRVILNKGRLETIYLGKTAAGQACIYDKGAQVGNDALTLTRVEVHCHPNRPAADLHTLKNPFTRLRVFDVANASLKIGGPHAKTLARAMRAEGTAAPLADFPLGAAAEIKAAIFGSTADFWKPGDIWKQWPAAIKAAFPSFGNAAHYGTADLHGLAPGVAQSIAESYAMKKDQAGFPKANDNEPPLRVIRELTEAEAAHELRISVDTLQRERAEGKIGFARRRRRVLYPLSCINDYRKSQICPPTSTRTTSGSPLTARPGTTTLRTALEDARLAARWARQTRK